MGKKRIGQTCRPEREHNTTMEKCADVFGVSTTRVVKLKVISTKHLFQSGGGSQRQPLQKTTHIFAYEQRGSEINHSMRREKHVVRSEHTARRLRCLSSGVKFQYRKSEVKRQQVAVAAAGYDSEGKSQITTFGASEPDTFWRKRATRNTANYRYDSVWNHQP